MHPASSTIFRFTALQALKIIKYQTNITISQKLDSTFAAIKDDKNYQT